MHVNFRGQIISAVEEATRRSHEGEEWTFSRLESSAGGDVRAAAPDLSGFGVPAGSPEGADGGAAQVGRPDAGADTRLQAAGGVPDRRLCRGQRAKEAPPQQKRSGETDTQPRGKGYADDDDLFHGSCKTPKCLNVGSSCESLNIAACLLYFC